MWLLHTSTLLLHEFVGANIPPYAILSHTWGSAAEEVSFRDMQRDRLAAASKAGYSKVQKCCLKAARDGHRYVWIDTCCIDKRSSAELSEAINSMYKWYQNAKVCYVYLVDVPSSGFDPSPEVRGDPLSKSRWFTRGWTLQELIAPRYIQFLGQDWNLIGTKIPGLDSDFDIPVQNVLDYDFSPKLAIITGITEEVLKNTLMVPYVPSALKIYWASRRQTTREEDIAYALMGLFGINMPILYGEGQKKAFERLQLEIIKTSQDQSIFAWRADRSSSGLLAQSPFDFVDSRGFGPWSRMGQDPSTFLPYNMTNLGLSVSLPLQNPDPLDPDHVVASLRCWDANRRSIMIHLRRIRRGSEATAEDAIYRRTRCDELEIASPTDGKRPHCDIYVLEDEQFEHIRLFGILSGCFII